MTQRDWQKDMDDVKTYLKSRRLIHHEVQTLRGEPVADVLHYWLQEAKERGEREQRLKEAYKHAAESIYTNHSAMNHMENTEYEEGQINGMIQAANILRSSFSTLYPDTPAPKKERDTEFTTALGEAWDFIKGDGSFTGSEIKLWTNSLGSELSRRILRAVIQTAWSDYGGNLKEGDNQ